VRSRPVQIVVTPGSGEGRARATARRLRRRLASRGRETGIRSFDNLAALTQWAETCEPEFSHLVCIGGDGTLSAAARAAIRHGVPFVPVPNGFGNIFARVFGHPKRARDVSALLETGEVRRVDVGLARNGPTEELFLSHRSFGVLEQIQQVAERGRQQPQTRFLRYLWYWGVAYQFFFRTRLAAFTVEVDGTQVADDAVLVTVANVETYRGFLSLTPKATPIDGLFDVAVVPRVSQVVLLAGLLRLLFSRLGRWRRLKLYRGRRVVVTTPRRREELTVRRRALPLLVPPGAIEELQRRTIEDEPPLPA
jgi:diacylglycerol kinase family enzyme